MGLGEKKKVIAGYISQGLKVLRALEIAGISKHQYYYLPQKGKRGRKASTHTQKYEQDHWIKVPNNQVLLEIETIKVDPDLDAGYQNISRALQQRGYFINQKKTYRLMKENNLLKEKHKKNPKRYVKYRKVLPYNPLEVLEMDIKMVWVERHRCHAFILNVIDTFSRKWLYHWVGFSVTQYQVKAAWEHIITKFLQPNNCLERKVHIEIRNDNDKRFSARMIQDFFRDNHLNQVFTHPYTPQENGHVESFHGILSKHLNRQYYWSIEQLEQDLILFMEKYNNQRLHGSIAHLTPNDFESLFYQELIQVQINERRREIKFKPLIKRWLINKHTGNDEPEGSLLHEFEPFEGAKNSKLKEMCGANISNNTRFKESPSVVSCESKVSKELSNIVVN